MDARLLWRVLPERLRELPADLAATAVLVAVTNVAVFAPVVRDTPLRLPVGLVALLFVPGYALMAALFPERGEEPTDTGTGVEEPAPSVLSGVDGIERAALSFGLSIALVPLVGLVLTFTPWGLQLVPTMAGLTGFTLVAVAVADYRRRQVPPDDRFRVPYRNWIRAGRSSVVEPPSRADAALNIVLVASVLLAVGAVGYAVVVPPDGEQFTEFYLVSENDDGELVAANYPEELTAGESAELVVGVENREERTVSYTVVAQLQSVATEGNETRVLDSRELERFETTLAHNESRQYAHNITPTMTGDSLRLQYLLFTGPVPAEPTEEAAYRELHLWVDVSPTSQ